jgi:hypothetical protein
VLGKLLEHGDLLVSLHLFNDNPARYIVRDSARSLAAAMHIHELDFLAQLCKNTKFKKRSKKSAVFDTARDPDALPPHCMHMEQRY